jgi:subtilisin family serine protease
MPSAAPEELAEAIVVCIREGARVLNISAALTQPSSQGERSLQLALDYAAVKRTIVVAASGNQGSVGSTALTRHPWVIPVAACDLRGWPLSQSNLGSSIGRRGLLAPGEDIISLGALGTPMPIGGTSAAAPFVTGAVALLWSEFPGASAVQVKFAVTQASIPRKTITPPLLNAWQAYQTISRSYGEAI